MNDRVPDGDESGGDGTGRDDETADDEAETHSAAHVATDGEEWRFSADDLDGPEELEPGSPTTENIVFVLVGVAFALAVIAQFAL